METKFNPILRRTGRNLLSACFLAAFMMFGAKSYGQALLLDYNDMEYENTYQQSADSFFNYVWDINKNIPNNDTTYNYDLGFANVRFDTLIDFDYTTGVVNQSIPFSGRTIRLDSFQLYYNHVRTVTTSADTMYVYVYDLSTGVNTGTAPNDKFTATWLWKDSLKVTGSANMNTSGTSLGNGFYYLTRKPNLTLPAGHTFGIYVEFRGNKRNSFEMIGGYRDNCNKACVAAASMAGFNSDFYLDLKQGTTVYSGIQSDIGIYYDCDGSQSLTPNSCENFYIQDFLLPAYVTVSSASGSPTVVTTGATAIATTTATLKGTVNANGLSSTTGFQWGTTTGYTGGNVTGTPSPVTGSNTTAFTYALTGLTAGTIYHYRAMATNSSGTNYGRDTTFTTLQSVVGGSCDTVFNMISANDAPYIVPVGVTDDSGYIAGNNFYGDVAKAEGFPSVIGDHVSSAILEFAIATMKTTDSGNLVKVMVWDNSGTDLYGNPGAPGRALDSTTVSLRSIAYALGAGFAIQVNFTGQAALTTDTFYVGVVLPTTTGDTLALAMDGSNDDGDGWENNPAFGGWGSYVNDWGWTLHAGNYIEAIQCPAATGLSVTVTPANVLCHGGTGSATANASGGNGTYTYVWSNGTTTASITNVASGSYTVTVTSNSVTASASATITQPATALSASATATTTACATNTGTTTSTVTGGTSGYTYHWSNGATTANLTALAANTYTLTVTDANGCSTTASATVSRPNAFTVTVSPTSAACFGQSTGSATASASGATGNLTYSWSNSGTSQTISSVPAATYNVTVTDANGCSSSASASVGQPASAVTASATSTITSCGSNTGTATVTAGGGTAGYTYAWSNSTTGTTITGLGVGNYNVTVSDAHSCTATATTSVNTSATFVINVSSTNVGCFGQSTGTASASATGTTGNVIYVWSNTATTQNITLLPAGTYNVTVTDGSGCPKTSSTTVSQPASALTASLTTAPTNCTSNTGTATASVSGGTTAYNYAWSNSSTTSTASGLAVGNINLTVTDNNGCTATASGTISLPPVYTVSATSTAANCNGQNSGSVTAVASGNGNYTYVWSNGGTAATISNVAAAPYTVTVTDGFGCTVTATSTVSQPTAVAVTATSTDATNGSNGTANASATGGTASYQYSWSDQETTANITGLAAGTYTVTVTDANNCSGTATVTIIATGINEVSGNITNITLIPNPATDQVKIVVSLATAQAVEFRLVDITGKYIYTANESTVQGNVTHQINLNQYASGIYLVEITAGNDVIRKKLVIAK